MKIIAAFRATPVLSITSLCTTSYTHIFFQMKSSSSSLLVVVTIAAALTTAVEGMDPERHKAACDMWAKIDEKTIPLQNQGHANCTTNEECTGFNCKGVFQVRRTLTHT